MPNREPKVSQEIPPIVEVIGFRLSTATILFHTAVADRLGLNVTDLKCYSLIRQAGSMSAGELAEQTHLTTGAITGVADRLEKVGLVRRGRDAADRRRVLIEWVHNPDYEELMQQLYGPMGRGIAHLVGNYSEGEQQILLDFLTKATQILETATEQLRHGATK